MSEQRTGPRMIGRTDGEALDATPLLPVTSGVVMAAKTTRSSYTELFGQGEFSDPTLPKAGTQIYYRRRFDGKWIRAVVLDPAREGMDEPMGFRTLHLAVDLADVYRQISPAGSPDGVPLASSPLGFRQNVIEGLERGEWQIEKPEAADEQFEAEQRRKQDQAAMRREQAQEGGLIATHRGKLPRGVK